MKALATSLCRTAMSRLPLLPPLFLFATLALWSGCDAVSEPEPDDDDGWGREPYARVGEYFYADWGPDDRLAVRHVPKDSAGYYHDDQGGLYTINLDGTEKRRVLLDREAGAPIQTPQWSPDGRWIAFQAGGQLFKVTSDGSDLQQLTEGEEAKLEFAWSPDGEQLLYKVIFGLRKNRGLWVVGADGTGQRPLRKPPVAQQCLNCPIAQPNGAHGGGSSWDVQGPDWGPRGNEVVYVAFENVLGDVHLALYDTTTAQVEFIRERRDGGFFNPKFSPDGSKILFWTSPDRIGLVNREGGRLRWLTEEGKDPSWSPDGRQIVYRRNTGDQRIYQNPGYGEIWIMDAGGSGKRQVTHSVTVPSAN